MRYDGDHERASSRFVNLQATQYGLACRSTPCSGCTGRCGHSHALGYWGGAVRSEEHARSVRHLKSAFRLFYSVFFSLRVLIKAASLSSVESTRGWCLKFAPAPMQCSVPPSTFFLIRAPLRQQVDSALALSRQHLWFVLALGWQRIDLPPRPLTAASRLHA